MGEARTFRIGIALAVLAGVVALTCTDHTVELGLVKPPTRPPSDATDTQRLMAAAGRDV